MTLSSRKSLKTYNMVILFDFDGVIADTENQYTLFWNRIGKEYLGLDGFGHTIKGQTLVQIFAKHFNGMEREQEEIIPQLHAYEEAMSYEYIPGAAEFMKAIRKAGIRSAIVTSSNNEKMSHVYKAHPELTNMVDVILTSEHFSRSKPDPECFLKGMEILGGTPQTTIVFEDSIHGINAGRSAGAKVIGLATTNPREIISPLCNRVIDDFTGLSMEDLF